MRVVLVSRFPAFPVTAGNRSRIRQLAQAIQALGHELIFVYLESMWETADEAAHEAAFGPGRYIRIGKRYARAKWLRDLPLGAVKRVLRRAGLEAAYYSTLDRFRDREVLARVAELHLRPDVVVVEYVLDSWVFAAFPATVRRVLDTHDAFGDRHKAYVDRGIRDYWVSLRPQAENAGFRRAHVVLAIQQEEAHRFAGQLASDLNPANPEVAVVSHFVQLGAPAVDYSMDHAAVFLASDNPANRHALQVLLEHILPRVLREIPGFRLKLAGSICRGLGDASNVVKLGWVDDIQQVFAQAPVSVNPMHAGTGINVKLLDAMACGVPTVSTVTGARGVPHALRGGVHIVPDDDPQAFATALVRLATDAALRRSTGLAARNDAQLWNAQQLSELGRCLAGS